ncbi:alpha/beta fold hydrolase [Parasphingorhabdus cellanae]|uniref:Proline iminopeptidase n=1 Tax=Parasphingorhabdus cellanae TaxID=2806553 RepID=A0ABX7T1R7_9SPHN|nr:alpha/beta hydrolase [Parasphingorhabdus cellanae]QTD55509.1 alpha/beta hydrolase [Parasphingorhabdus cellanae]
MRIFIFWISVAFVLIGGGDLSAREAPETRSLSTGSEVATWVISADDPQHKTPILYLHGGPGMYTEDRRIEEGQLFRNLGFNTVYYDQAGGGQSGHIRASEYTVDRAVLDLEALRSSLNTEKLILWGNSYGATLAAIYADRYPDQVAALIFTSPGTFPGTKPKRNYKVTARGKIKVNKSVKKAIKIIDGADPDAEEKLTQADAGVLFDGLLNSGMMAGMICKESDIEVGTSSRGGNFYANRRIQDTIRTVRFDRNDLPKVPTITLRGSCDFHLEENAQLYSNMFGGALVEIKASGHGLLENQHLVRQALKEFAETALANVE